MPGAVKSVTIIGMGSTQRNVPESIQTDEVWGVNDASKKLADRVDMAVNLHEPGVTQQGRPLSLETWTAAHWKKKLMVRRPYPNVASEQIVYPLEQVIEAMRGDRSFAADCWHRCTVTYLIAYAWLQGIERLDLYGIDMRDTNWRQGIATAVMVHWAQTQGMEVNLPPESPFFRMKDLYGSKEHMRRVSWK